MMVTKNGPRRGYHDIGGLPEGAIDRSGHVLEPWEKRVDALRGILGDDKRRLLRTDGLRNAIETMGEDLYLELSYYERWMAAIIKVLTEKGVLTRQEIEARMDDIVERLGITPPAKRPMPPAGR
ncbi:MAG: nitrile hydratase subunit beta [Gammaproteobacteria bacterium]|nr:nitrile hydratase subunit beta [Gammaproteobacteria bacterium]